ncbi:MAG: IS110 family transposase [Acidovorax soli]|uniref:IS110 family transposase n=1 Tax=Acidovorax soli TaxID=592050 RepID=UPI0026EC5317|nr:IS110 family transposase [Acidovorax soli]MCM2347817.1 IS110 family transposase [Acidovorax soli]
MRVIGLDVSRTFGEIAYLENGLLRPGGRVVLQHAELERFAQSLRASDEVVLEATGNTAAIVTALKPHVAKVVIANPLQVRLIAEARVKTDKIDAAILAQLYASGFLPQVWMPDERTLTLRRQVARRSQIVRHRTRLKNEIHGVLASHLIPHCPATDLFGNKGRAWLGQQPLPMDERLAVEQRLRELDRLEEDLAAIENLLCKSVLQEEQVKRLLTITGVNCIVAIGLLAAIGDIGRFASAAKLVSYFGLNPRVRQSGLQPAQHGHISKVGRAHARAMLVEAAWSAANAPGPLRAFFLRIRGRRGQQIAAVATARKLAVIAWHMLTGQEDFAWTRPALAARKRRELELRAGLPVKKGHRGPAADYNVKEIREREHAAAQLAEQAYTRFVANWQPKNKSSPPPLTPLRR